MIKYWDQDRLPSNLFCGLHFKLLPKHDQTDTILKENWKKATFSDPVLIHHIVDTVVRLGRLANSSYFEPRSAFKHIKQTK